MRSVVALVLFACPLSMSHAQDSASKDIVAALVARLVSPNRAPTIPGATPKYPLDYDKKAQEDVFRAYSELCNLGASAFPYLFDHFADERYSLTADRGAAYGNFSVGELCYDIVALQLQPYGRFTRGEGDPRSRPRRPYYPGHIRLHDREAARKWWEVHKNMTLREMQMEALQWVIDEESKDPKSYNDLERRWLAETLESLSKSDQALKRGVPWSK